MPMKCVPVSHRQAVEGLHLGTTGPTNSLPLPISTSRLCLINYSRHSKQHHEFPSAAVWSQHMQEHTSLLETMALRLFWILISVPQCFTSGLWAESWLVSKFCASSSYCYCSCFILEHPIYQLEGWSWDNVLNDVSKFAEVLSLS